MSAGDVLRREVRVALSRRAQPVWFRVVKWILAIAVTIRLWNTPYFWWWIWGSLSVSLTVHCIWRWKTRGWTRPWGGWNDLEAGR